MWNDLRECISYDEWSAREYGETSVDLYTTAQNLIEKGYRKQSVGEWIDKPTGAYGRMQSWCSACGKHSGIGGIESNRHKSFCPNCGARMKDGADATDINVGNKSEWISVDDRLPEERVKCLVYYKHAYCDIDGYRDIGTAFFYDGCFDVGLAYKVTHWMPLPAQPKGAIDEN